MLTMPSADFKIDYLSKNFNAHLDTFGTTQSRGYLDQANILIDQKKGTIETLHELFSATTKSKIEVKKKSEAIKNLKNLTQRQKEKELWIFKIFYSLFNSLSIPFTEKMQKYHDIESHVFQTEPIILPDQTATESPNNPIFLMDGLGYVQKMVQKMDAEISLKRWRSTIKSEDMKKWFNPEEKCEIPKPKPIPFRRPPTKILEETSFSKNLDGGSFYDPNIDLL
jgi:hypothetical protein